MAKKNGNRGGQNLKDMTGKVFGRLRVIRRDGTNKHRNAVWLCECECSKRVRVSGCDLRSGKVLSCSCYQKSLMSVIKRTHGRSRTPEYEAWLDMVQRCSNQEHPSFPDYGGRGIKVCERWMGESGVNNFIKDMGMRPSPRQSIDRIDNNGNYEPGNCRWATRKQQMRNTRRNRMLTLNGETLSMSEWAERYSVSYASLQYRLKKGLSLEESIDQLVSK